MTTLEKVKSSRHSISDNERKLRQARIEELVLECREVADEQDFTQDEMFSVLTRIEPRYPNDKGKWRNNKAVFKVLDRVEKTFKKFKKEYSNNMISSRDIANYLYSKVISPNNIKMHFAKIIGSYYVIRRAYANKGHINISHLNIFNDKGVLRFKSSRQNSNGNMYYEVEGIVILNSINTITLLSLSTLTNSHMKDSFIDTVNICLNNDSVPSRLYGLYNGMCGKYNTPYSTPVTFIKTEDEADQKRIMSVRIDDFMPKGNKELEFLKDYRTEHNQPNIFKDIWLTIKPYNSDSYGGLRQFRSY